MAARMPNLSLILPEAQTALLDLTKAIRTTGIPLRTLVLVHLRVSQLNGRDVQLPKSSSEFEAAGEEDRRLPMVTDWRNEPSFSAAERAAMALGEAGTDICDHEDPVPDEVWDEAARHYSEEQMAALVIHIGLVNLWNRVNIVTRQEPVDWRVNPKTWTPMTERVQPL